MPIFVSANLPFLTASIPIARPDLADSIDCPGNAAVWAYGAWTQIVAANDLANHALSHVFVIQDNSGGGGDWQLQVGVGATGLEAPIYTTDGNFNGANRAGLTVKHVFPLIIIPANTRVAARVAASLANTGQRVALHFLPLPL